MCNVAQSHYVPQYGCVDASAAVLKYFCWQHRSPRLKKYLKITETHTHTLGERLNCVCVRDGSVCACVAAAFY